MCEKHMTTNANNFRGYDGDTVSFKAVYWIRLLFMGVFVSFFLLACSVKYAYTPPATEEGKQCVSLQCQTEASACYADEEARTDSYVQNCLSTRNQRLIQCRYEAEKEYVQCELDAERDYAYCLRYEKRMTKKTNRVSKRYATNVVALLMRARIGWTIHPAIKPSANAIRDVVAQ